MKQFCYCMKQICYCMKQILYSMKQILYGMKQNYKYKDKKNTEVEPSVL